MASPHSSTCSSPSSFRLQSDSVQRWLDDLRHMTEVECMCVLQAKPLGVDEEELLVSSGGAWPARSNLQTLLRRALVVSTELGRMFSRVEKGRWQRTHSTATRAESHLRSLLQQYTTGRGVSPELLQYEKILLEKSQELTSITERCVQSEDQSFLKSSRESIHQILTDLSQDFSAMIDLALANEIRVLVEQVECSSQPETVDGAISSLLSLTQDGPQLCSIIAQ
ncbi:protein inscuteable homolog, partial [Eucyclogobius newberryi]